VRGRFVLLACLVVAVAAAWPAAGVGRPLASVHRLARADYAVARFRFTQAGSPLRAIRNIVQTFTAGSGTISVPDGESIDLSKPGAFHGPAAGKVVLEVERVIGRTQTITMDVVSDGNYYSGSAGAGVTLRVQVTDVSNDSECPINGQGQIQAEYGVLGKAVPALAKSPENPQGAAGIPAGTRVNSIVVKVCDHSYQFLSRRVPRARVNVSISTACHAGRAPAVVGGAVAVCGSPAPTEYYVFILTNVASPGNIWVGSLSSVAGKFTCDFVDGGLCAGQGGSNTPVTYTEQLGPYATCPLALAAYSKAAMNPHPAFGGTKVYIFGGSYFIDNMSNWCSG